MAGRLGHCLRDELGEVSNILFGRIERAHPAHDRLLFNPSVEKVAFPNLGNGVAWNLGEDTIGFDLPDDFHCRYSSDLFFQESSHAIGVLSAAPPEIVGQQCLQLNGDETHLGRKLHALFAYVKEIPAEFTIKENYRLAAYDPVLSPAE